MTLGLGPQPVARPALVWCARFVAASTRSADALAHRWVAILAGMVLVTAAAFGPEQLPPSVAWSRTLGARLFGGETGLRVVCVLAHLVRRRGAPAGACVR